MSDDSWSRNLQFSDVVKIFLIGAFLIYMVTLPFKKDKVQNVSEEPQSQVVLETIIEPVYDLSQVDYEIFKETDISFPSARRFDIRVVVKNDPVVEGQIKVVSEKIVLDYKSKADAISILFYSDESQIDDAYTLAMAEWAPNGKWADADLKTNQILVYSFKEIVKKEVSQQVILEENNEVVVDSEVVVNESVVEEKVVEVIDVDAIIENHCKFEWPNDINMKNYCKGGQYDGLATLNIGKPFDISEDKFVIIRSYCEYEWPSDFSMRAYCEDGEYDAVRTLAKGKPVDIGDVEFGIIQSNCKYEWPTDFSMRMYCESNQYDAVRTLSQGKPANVSELVFEAVRANCEREWPTDYNMRVYCEKQSY